MAKYSILHTCGHTSTATLFGKNSQRDWKIAQLQKECCDECDRKSRMEAAATAGPLLEGSEKQIVWAVDIRKAQAAEIEQFTAKLTSAPIAPGREEMAVKFFAALETEFAAYLAETSASVWIDRRNRLDCMATAKAAHAKIG